MRECGRKVYSCIGWTSWKALYMACVNLLERSIILWMRLLVCLVSTVCMQIMPYGSPQGLMNLHVHMAITWLLLPARKLVILWNTIFASIFRLLTWVIYTSMSAWLLSMPNNLTTFIFPNSTILNRSYLCFLWPPVILWLPPCYLYMLQRNYYPSSWCTGHKTLSTPYRMCALSHALHASWSCICGYSPFAIFGHRKLTTGMISSGCCTIFLAHLMPVLPSTSTMKMGSLDILMRLLVTPWIAFLWMATCYYIMAPLSPGPRNWIEPSLYQRSRRNLW